MKKLKASITAIILAVIGIVGIAEPVTTYAADTYYVRKEQFGDLVDALYIKNGTTGEDVVAYCYNAHKVWPGSRDISVTKFENASQEKFLELAASPRDGGTDLKKHALEVCYKGFPRDGIGLKQKYNLDNDVFRMITQAAIWYYTDSQSMTQTQFWNSYSWMWTNDAKNAYNELISTKVNLPSNYTLDLYQPNSSSMQNFLSTKLPKDYTPPTQPETTKTVSVKKEWELYGHAESEISNSVQVQLYEDGTAYGDPVTLNKANGWKYEWKALDDSKEYTVKEVKVPDGCVSRVEKGDDDSGVDFVIYNSMKPELVIKKVVEGEFGDKTKEFSFRITLKDGDGKELNGKYSYVKEKEDGTELSSGTIEFKDGLSTFKLAHAQTLRIKELPPGTSYFLQEVNVGDDHTPYYYYKDKTRDQKAGTGTITNTDLNNEVKVVNLYNDNYVPDTGIKTNSKYMMSGAAVIFAGMLLFAGVTIMHFRKRLK